MDQRGVVPNMRFHVMKKCLLAIPACTLLSLVFLSGCASPRTASKDHAYLAYWPPADGAKTRVAVKVEPGPDLTLVADGDQLDQLLINLIRNASDAVAETGGGVRVAWHAAGAGVEVVVEDDGPGIVDTANLFVPFYTTKPGGSGVGLALSRQIADAHGGRIKLENRKDARGCLARLWLPLG